MHYFHNGKLNIAIDPVAIFLFTETTISRRKANEKQLHNNLFTEIGGIFIA